MWITGKENKMSNELNTDFGIKTDREQIQVSVILS